MNNGYFHEMRESDFDLEPETDDAQTKLDRLKQMSNVIQALENVLNQCGDHEEYSRISNFCQREIFLAQQKLKNWIHEH